MKKLLLIAALALSSVAAFAETYTVSIGINDYPTVVDEDGQEIDNDLFGCVNDAKAMKNVFVKNYGVKEANTRIILDKDATGEKFLESIQWLIGKAKVGDQIVFSYSGHGGQLEDPDAPSGEGTTEVIALADDTYVQDTFFKEVAELFRINGVNATFIFDSCHSGGMSRPEDKKIRIRQKSLGIIKPKQKDLEKMANLKKGFLSIRSKQVKTDAKLGETMFLFASEKDKTSSDISGLEGIPAHGLFTMLLLEFIEADKNFSVSDLYSGLESTLKEINASLLAQGKEEGMDEKEIPQFTQGPNYEGSAARASKPIILPN